MGWSVRPRYVTVALLAVTVIGAIGWVGPFVQTPNAGGSGYTVEHVSARADGRVTTATLYLPDGDEQVPGVVFGAGSGTAPALYANWAAYLASHPRVDGDRLVFGGHSGGANSAYRVAYQRPGVDGVVAIAARFPPETDDRFPTNLLLATGSEDSLVPPSKLTNVSAQLTGTALRPGQRVGPFADGTATRVTVAEGATHLSESDNPELVRETTDWALRSVGESPPATLGITVRSIGSVVTQFLFGLVGVLAATELAKRGVTGRVDDRRRRDGLVALAWLAGFAVVLHTTVSQRISHLGPTPEQTVKYVLLGGLVLGIGLLLDRVASALSRADSRSVSALLDLAFLFVPAGAFVLVSTQFVTFQLVTTVVLSSVVLAVLAAVLAAP
jgi:hypothetical protein